MSKEQTGKREYTPEYLAYCESQGFGGRPEDMNCYDRERYPGGKMAGFIAWRLEDLSARRRQIEAEGRSNPGKTSAKRGQIAEKDKMAKGSQNVRITIYEKGYQAHEQANRPPSGSAGAAAVRR